MLSNSQPRVAVIGTGWVAERVHLPYFRDNPAVRLVGVLDTDVELAAAVAERNGTCAFDSLARLLEESDVVSVCTPGVTHYGIVEAALDAGKHVICEKPLAMSAIQARRLTEVARDRNVELYCCMTMRYRADVRTLALEISKGLIGQPRLVEASWLRSNGLPGRPGPLTQGVLWDLGSHLVDLALWATGWDAPTRVDAYGTLLSPARAGSFASWYEGTADPVVPVDVEYDTVFVDFAGPGEAYCRTHVSWSAQLPADHTRLLVVGDEGALELRTVFGWSPHRQTMQGDALRVSLGSGAWQTVHAGQDREHLEYRAQFDHMLGLAAEDSTWITDLAPTLTSISVLERAQECLDLRNVQ